MKPFFWRFAAGMSLVFSGPLLAQAHDPGPTTDDVAACIDSLPQTSPEEYLKRMKQCLAMAERVDSEEATLISGAYLYRLKFGVFAIENKFDIDSITRELRPIFLSVVYRRISEESITITSNTGLIEAATALASWDWYVVQDDLVRSEEAIVTELGKRQAKVDNFAQDLYYRYDVHRLFDRAVTIVAKFGIVPPFELPASIKRARDFSKKKPAFYEVDLQKRTLKLVNVELSRFTGVIVTTYAKCPEARLAAEVIEKDPAMKEAFRKRALWLADQDSIRFDELAEWQNRYPWAPLKPTYLRKSWPIKTRPVPRFYFFRDGALIETIAEFDLGRVRTALRKLDLVGSR